MTATAPFGKAVETLEIMNAGEILEVGITSTERYISDTKRGYAARGIDRNDEMIVAAQRPAAREHATIDFAVTDHASEIARDGRYDVVSASSLVCVLRDPKEGLARLRALAKPGGHVLVIEAAPYMSRWRASRLIARGRLGTRSQMLLAWSMARSGRALPRELFSIETGFQSKTSLLEGFVAAYVLSVGA